MFGEINAIRALATKYSKQQLANLAQTGQIEPQKAVLAGMMIDRIAKTAMEPPQTTVAQDVLGVQGSGTGTMAGETMGAEGQQLGPTAPPPQMPPQMAADGGLMGMLPYSNGVAALPSGMHDMAEGGIVAFADGGDVPGYADGKLTDSRNDPAMRIPASEQRRRDMEYRLPILLQELKEAQAKGRTADVQAIQREIRAMKPAPSADSGLTALIPTAQAATQEQPVAAQSAAPMSQEERDRADFQSGLGKLGAAAKDVLTLPGRAVAGAAESVITRPLRAMGVDVPYLPDEYYGGNRESMTPYYDKLREKEPAEQPKKPEAKVEQLPPISAPVKEEPVRVESTGGGKSTLGEIKAEQLPQKPELKFSDAYKEQQDAYREAGVNSDIYRDFMRDVDKKKEGLKDRREKALGAAIASMGFDFMGARQGQEFERLGSAGRRAVAQYTDAMDKITENEDKLDTLNREILMAENTYKRTGADSALARIRDRETRRDNIEAKNADYRQDAAKHTETLKVNVFGHELTSNTQLTIAQQNATARLAAAMLAQQNKGALTAKQLFDIKQQMKLELGPKLREQYKDIGNKEQVEARVEKELDIAIENELSKLKNNPAVGSPGSGKDLFADWSVEGT
jgi:hypothetical protein